MRTQREAPARRRLALAPLLVASLLLGPAPRAPRCTSGRATSRRSTSISGEPKEAVSRPWSGMPRRSGRRRQGAAGLHAQLGLLYSQLGKDDQMVREFTTEKALFPESTTYMDFLMKNVKRDGGQK